MKSNTHSSQPFVLIKWVPSEAHDHRSNLKVICAKWRRIIPGPNLSISKVYSGRGDRAHGLERLIRQIRCSRSEFLIWKAVMMCTPVGQPKSFPPLPNPRCTAPESRIGNGDSGVSPPAMSALAFLNVSVRKGAVGRKILDADSSAVWDIMDKKESVPTET